MPLSFGSTKPIAIIGYQEVNKTLNALGLAMKKMGSHNMKTVANILLEDLREHFQDQGKDIGGWTKLAEYTKKKKARLGYDPRILISHRNPHMFERFQSKGYPNAALVTTNDPIASIHEHGTSDGRIPARPMFYISVRAQEKIFSLAFVDVDAAMRV